MFFGSLRGSWMNGRVLDDSVSLERDPEKEPQRGHGVIAARAQPSKVPTIGFLGVTTPSASSQWVAAFVQRLRELGWIDGRNVAIEYRWSDGRNERYAVNAAEFVRLKVGVIVTQGTAPVLAAMRATSVIPIVFAGSGDPVANGLVASLARPRLNS